MGGPGGRSGGAGEWRAGGPGGRAAGCADAWAGGCAGVPEALVRPVFHMEQTGRKGLTGWGVAHPDQAALRVQAGNEQLFHMKHIHP